VALEFSRPSVYASLASTSCLALNGLQWDLLDTADWSSGLIG
jgi:hypothetical protein